MSTRTFHLYRDEDVSGVSGEGTVADGVEFDDGVVVLHWRGEYRSTVIWPHIDEVMAVHGHDGRTHAVWHDEL